ncbi:MAG: HAD family phosphatase [Vicinamibacterales bacterium]
MVFDMDGLMLDTEPLYKLAWQSACAGLGYHLSDALYVGFVGRPTPDCEGRLIEEFGSAFPLEAFRREWPALWRAAATERGIRVKSGLLELLAFLHERSVPIAVATSSEAEFTAFSLRQAGLAGRFATFVTGDQVALGKPAPDIYLRAAEQLGVPPERCVALEDSEAGIVAACAAGMVALLIPDWVPASDVAARAAAYVMPSLVEARNVIAELAADASSSHEQRVRAE